MPDNFGFSQRLLSDRLGPSLDGVAGRDHHAPEHLVPLLRLCFANDAPDFHLAARRLYRKFEKSSKSKATATSYQDAPLWYAHLAPGFMKVLHEISNFTTADENGGLGGSVGADRGTAVPQAATSLNRKVAAQERCSHIKTAFS